MELWLNGLGRKLSYVAAKRTFMNSAIWFYRRGNQTGIEVHTADTAQKYSQKGSGHSSGSSTTFLKNTSYAKCSCIGVFTQTSSLFKAKQSK